MSNLRVVYPGTFDPFTHGHNDLVRRAAAMFDRVTVAIAESQRKAPFFATSDRVDMAKAVLADVTVALFPGKYAGLREKPYYDEVLAKLLAANRSFAAENATPTPAPAHR